MTEQNPHALEVNPDTSLQFLLTRDPSPSSSTKSDSTARCTMTLSHPGKTSSHIAFKVKTTQPRRYLVRPNQGIISPNSSEKVTILLVEKDKQMLLQSFDRLGQSALDHSKDKFLVQSCMVDESFAMVYQKKKEEMESEGEKKDATATGGEVNKVGKELAESLTGMWNKASSGSEIPIYNKKLQVKHAVASTAGSSGTDGKSGAVTLSGAKGGPGGMTQSKPSLDSMTPEQMFAEITSLRRKYDELVTFSVNLTAERDILNNTLEQTKRDLNREIARSKENRAGGNGAVTSQAIGGKSGGSGGFLSFLMMIFVGVIFFLIGVKAKHMDIVDFLFDLPVLGDVLKAEL